MDDLLAEFVAETREMLQASEGEIVAWEADPTDRSRLDAIFRLVHTVKGNCGFFDFPQLERLSHAAESALADIRSDRRRPDSALVTAVLAVVDRIAEMISVIEAGEELKSSNQDESIILALEQDASDLGEVGPQDATGGTARPSHAAQAVPRTIRLPVELLDRVMSGVSDLVLARNDLARRLRDAGADSEIDAPFDRLSAILGDVRDAVSRMRMQRIEHLFNSIPRLVRDLSAELQKQVMVDIAGNGVELDREMIELMRDPITHIIRNAVDHGIETPSERLAKDKHEIGLISVSAAQSGNRIILRLSDDGKGLDIDRIGAKAVEAGIVSQSDLEAMDSNEVLNLIFAPGLSTADEVSSISGRGVGMDVVRANIERFGGSIRVSTVAGKETSFHLTLPLTLTIIGGLTVAVGEQRFAIPRSFVDEIVHTRSNALDLAGVGDANLVTFRGERIRLVDLRDELGITETSEPQTCGAYIIVRLATGERMALGVDRVQDHEELVIKPVSPEVAATDLYAGLTLLDDGRPILLLDVMKIAQRSGLVVHKSSIANRIANSQSSEQAPAARSLMLFDGIDGKRRAMPAELVLRIDAVAHTAITIEQSRAMAVIDGQLFNVTGIDGQDLPEGLIKLMRISDGRRELVHAASQVIETISLGEAVVPDHSDPRIEGVCLIEDLPVPILNGHWLFAAHEHVAMPEDAPLCRLPDEDGWTKTILAPLIESAGFRVTHDPDTNAEVVIASVDGPNEIPASADQRVIVLRSAREAASNDRDSIYRYDRDAILGALRAAGSGRAS